MLLSVVAPVAVAVLVAAVVVAGIVAVRRRRALAAARKTPLRQLQKAGSSARVFTMGDIVFRGLVETSTYGPVSKGLLGQKRVILKELKPDVATTDEFQSKLNRLAKLDDDSGIVPILGVYVRQTGETSHELFLVMDLAWKGNMIDWMAKQTNPARLRRLVECAVDASSAMDYLERANIVHGDLAARNLLMKYNGQRLTPVVADYEVAAAFKVNVKLESPLKWSAPEVFERGEQTSASDSWAFGVVLWELFTNGEEPYADLSDEEYKAIVLDGRRLPMPAQLPDELVDLLHCCWNEDPVDRPNFGEIKAVLVEALRSLREADADDSEPSDDEDSSSVDVEVTSSATNSVYVARARAPEGSKASDVEAESDIDSRIARFIETNETVYLKMPSAVTSRFEVLRDEEDSLFQSESDRDLDSDAVDTDAMPDVVPAASARKNRRVVRVVKRAPSPSALDENISSGDSDSDPDSAPDTEDNKPAKKASRAVARGARSAAPVEDSALLESDDAASASESESEVVVTDGKRRVVKQASRAHTSTDPPLPPLPESDSDSYGTRTPEANSDAEVDKRVQRSARAVRAVKSTRSDTLDPASDSDSDVFVPIEVAADSARDTSSVKVRVPRTIVLPKARRASDADAALASEDDSDVYRVVEPADKPEPPAPRVPRVVKPSAKKADVADTAPIPEDGRRPPSACRVSSSRPSRRPMPLTPRRSPRMAPTTSTWRRSPPRPPSLRRPPSACRVSSSRPSRRPMPLTPRRSPRMAPTTSTWRRSPPRPPSLRRPPSACRVSSSRPSRRPMPPTPPRSRPTIPTPSSTPPSPNPPSRSAQSPACRAPSLGPRRALRRRSGRSRSRPSTARRPAMTTPISIGLHRRTTAHPLPSTSATRARPVLSRPSARRWAPWTLSDSVQSLSQSRPRRSASKTASSSRTDAPSPAASPESSVPAVPAAPRAPCRAVAANTSQYPRCRARAGPRTPQKRPKRYCRGHIAV
eukprot:TRINITY_DN4977_c0_g1_i9.p1 TRINITY_DN4977_c0_g1~~TRINITY_DN4977_c0_g1_i9.p1  ORF type:complete len:986 (+),score=264.77 TRINITY_DN4977_c0_g1_i9:219-3176(+)